MSARKTAYRILLDVQGGAHSGDLLFARLASLEARDAALATELVMGTLRRQSQLDFLIDHYAGRAVKLDPEVRVILRMGVHQLRNLRRIPAHAAVDESVRLVKFARKASAAGLVNAVLRKVDRAAVVWPSTDIAVSLPEWLLTKWTRDLGEARARGIAEASLLPPETYVRVPLSRAQDAEKHALEPTDVRGCYRMLGQETGGFRIQDISSQCVVPLLELEPRMTFLDVCAAPGGKTAQALESGVHAVACDYYSSRLRALGRMRCAKVALDASRPLPFRAKFERILVDAPCTGTGTLRRNPEIRWRVQPEDVHRNAARQRAILMNALEHLAPDGRLVYSTCSLEREENEDTVESVLEPLAGRFRWSGTMRRTPGEQPGDGFFAAVITSK